MGPLVRRPTLRNVKVSQKWTHPVAVCVRFFWFFFFVFLLYKYKKQSGKFSPWSAPQNVTPLEMCKLAVDLSLILMSRTCFFLRLYVYVSFCEEKALESWVLRENNTAAIQIYSNQPDEVPQQPHWGGEWQQAMALSMELLNDGNNVSQLGYMPNESSGRFATEWMSQSKSQELDHDLCNTVGRNLGNDPPSFESRSQNLRL